MDLKNKSVFIMSMEMKRKLNPSQKVMKEKPKKSPRIPPKSATKNIKVKVILYFDLRLLTNDVKG